ncbi:MAG: glycosyltransferase family 9 protein [Thermoleophilia bacterium]
MSGRRRIAVLRALPGLGDFLCAVPALRALRRLEPCAEVVLVGLARQLGLVRRYPALVDRLVELPCWPGLPEQPLDPAALPPFLAEMQERRLDLALQLHGSGGQTNALALLLGARETLGFHPADGWRPAATGFLPWVEEEPEPLRWLRLLRQLGPVEDDGALAFPVTDADRAELGALPGAARLAGRPYAVLHPGASTPARWADPVRAAGLADALAALGLAVGLTGSAGEADLVVRVRGAMRASGMAVPLAGATDLGPLAALLAGARVVVCGDTGVSHLAVAVGAPSVVLFGAASPVRWGPLDRRRHRVLPADAPVGRVLAECAALTAPGVALARSG